MNMSRNRSKVNTYDIVDTLPANAIKVSEYAKQWPCNVSYIYKLVKKDKHIGKFEIVSFHGINFVIPSDN